MADKVQKLRELAKWYEAFAERAQIPAIAEVRLRTVEYLQAEADRLDGKTPRSNPPAPSVG